MASMRFAAQLLISPAACCRYLGNCVQNSGLNLKSSTNLDQVSVFAQNSPAYLDVQRQSWEPREKAGLQSTEVRGKLWRDAEHKLVMWFKALQKQRGKLLRIKKRPSLVVEIYKLFFSWFCLVTSAESSSRLLLPSWVLPVTEAVLGSKGKKLSRKQESVCLFIF